MWKDAVLIRSYHRRMLSQEPLVMDKCRRWAARLRHSYWEGKKDQRKHAPLIWDLKSITGTCREEKKTSEASGQHCSSPSEGFPFSRRYQRHLKYCRQDHSSSLEEPLHGWRLLFDKPCRKLAGTKFGEMGSSANTCKYKIRQVGYKGTNQKSQETVKPSHEMTRVVFYLPVVPLLHLCLDESSHPVLVNLVMAHP